MKAIFKSLKVYEITYLNIAWIRAKLSTQGILLSKSQTMNLAINNLKTQLNQSLAKKNSTEDEG